MQNLAMDFFLRQQMDSEGWIDISMIASFNRLKSLTPDIAIIKEVMLLSSLLEVHEDSVRLAGNESRRWVLPDAKPSKFSNEALTSQTGNITPAAAGNGAEEVMDAGMMGIPSSLDPSAPGYIDGITGLTNGEDGAMSAPRFIAADVEHALMKNGNAGSAGAGLSVPTSASASVLNGDEKEEETPGTSMSGDKSESGETEAKELEVM